MGLRRDIERYREVGESNREDLTDYIKYGDLNQGGSIQVPIKIVELPEFEYDRLDMGGVGQGEDADVGDPVDIPVEPEDGEEGEAGDGEGEHDYYEMDPEEFARELDKELGLDLDPKGKKVVEETEGDYTDVSRRGPNSLLDIDTMFKEALKRKIALDFDEEYLREVLRVQGYGPRTAFEWARDENIPVSYSWLEQEYEEIPNGELSKWDSMDDIPVERDETPARRKEVDEIPLRRRDEQYRYPEIEKEKEKNVVVVNIRDVSGSMGESKRELVERVFSPLDWYLQGKYDNAEFIYIAHDAQAWEVPREEFFGIRSGGGTKVSSAFELAQTLLQDRYPWSEWNRFVFAAGDGENYSTDTEDNLIPLIEDIDANQHAYVETALGKSRSSNVGDQLSDHFRREEDVASTRVTGPEDVTDAIYEILSGDNNE